MQINEENTKWAIKKLSRFRSWQDFPPEIEGLNSRARSFLRLVHNRSVIEIMQEAFLRGTGTAMPDIDWQSKGMDPNQTDADWILDLIEETMERFPLPVQMRDIYRTKLPPASGEGA
jgi:hypothetical protein